MKDKVAIVTGAARGIGLAVASTFLAHGARVVLADMDREALEQAVKRLGRPDAAIAAQADVAAVPDVEAMVAACIRTFGRLDVLVNNAGGSARTPLRIEDVTEEHFDRVMAWNVRSTFFCIKAALPHLRAAGGGSIINMGSIAGRGGTELVSPQYSAAKAAVIGMTRNLARHLGPDGIRVNVIAPGFILSGPRIEEIWRTRDKAAVLKQVPLRRLGELADLTDVALFLASDASRYMTGAVLDVNGGFY
jgi:3-oxoacyl-[acyl-carrier protein] reductase